MATVQCPRCTVERKGFRRELDSWRHKLIHCVGTVTSVQNKRGFGEISPGRGGIGSPSSVAALANASHLIAS